MKNDESSKNGNPPSPSTELTFLKLPSIELTFHYWLFKTRKITDDAYYIIGWIQWNSENSLDVTIFREKNLLYWRFRKIIHCSYNSVWSIKHCSQLPIVHPASRLWPQNSPSSTTSGHHCRYVSNISILNLQKQPFPKWF